MVEKQARFRLEEIRHDTSGMVAATACRQARGITVRYIDILITTLNTSACGEHLQ